MPQKKKRNPAPLNFSDLYRVRPMMIAAFGLTVLFFGSLFLLPYMPNWLSFIGGILAGAIDVILWYSWRAEK